MKRRTFLAMAPVGAVAAASATALVNQTPPNDADISGDALPEFRDETFLTDVERRTVGAIFDRLIPSDQLSIGAVEAGCVTFLDRQLAGDWGRAATRYRAGPFLSGTPEQGDQSPFTPRDHYRRGLSALEVRCRRDYGKDFADLAVDEQDAELAGMEAGHRGEEAKALFVFLLQNVREGYFADPLYGGNKDMAGWKLVGFPGARYDYRAEIDRPGADLTLAPTSLMDRG